MDNPKIVSISNNNSGNISIEMQDGSKTIAYIDQKHKNLGFFKMNDMFYYFDVKTLEILSSAKR